jgi:hypothetical protein
VKTNEDCAENEELPWDQDNNDVCMVDLLVVEEPGIPADLELRSCMTEGSKWDEVHRAYASDSSSKWSGVLVRDIYNRANGSFVGAVEVSNKIDVWLGTVFFSVKRGGKQVLFTRRSVLRPVDEVADLTKELVLVVPAGARVRVSLCEGDMEEPPDAALAEWNREDLRTDILWWAHYGKSPHAKLIEMQDRAASVGFWPSMVTDIKYYFRTCACCKPNAVVRVGMGMCAIQAFQIVQMDDKIIPVNIRKGAGGRIKSVAVLTITCVCTGATVYALRKDMSAVTAGFLIFVHWIKRYGCFAVLWSDNAPAYVAEIMQSVAQCLGIRKQVFNSLGGHSRFVERAQAVLSKVLYEAEKTGQVMSDDDLTLWITAAEIQINQLDVVDRSTVFQRTHGQMPLTSRDLIAPSVEQATVSNMDPAHLLEQLGKLGADDKDSRLDNLQSVCSRLMGEHRLQQDLRARYNHSRRLLEEGKRVAVDFKNDYEGIDTGQIVSYQGERWVVLELIGSQDDEPVAAMIENSGSGVKKKVNFDLLRPLAVDRPVLVYPKQKAEYEILDVVVFKADGIFHMGMVMDAGTNEEGMTVQLLGGYRGKHASTWLPMWEPSGGNGNDVRKARCPGGYTANMILLDYRDIAAVVYLDGKANLTQESKNYLDSEGFELTCRYGGTEP